MIYCTSFFDLSFQLLKNWKLVFFKTTTSFYQNILVIHITFTLLMLQSTLVAVI
ncbi:hypothetical protein [Listeria monocytogenes]|uniref:hypothetical protein n=1 Tax=Listeria monocytogenes TaxID=1639 RepID=UPI001EE08FA3|nr:hypothetical protein [Listeria monocytogenes]MCG3304000.1 hypothetical protein [Listeria monocytogenes]